jgi:hypothetical protein
MFFRATTAAHVSMATQVAGWDSCGLFAVGAPLQEKPYREGSPERTLNSDEGGPGG